MTPFTQNILNLYGEKGAQWLQELPHHINRMPGLLKLEDLESVANQSFNHILKRMQDNRLSS